MSHTETNNSDTDSAHMQGAAPQPARVNDLSAEQRERGRERERERERERVTMVGDIYEKRQEIKDVSQGTVLWAWLAFP